METSTIQSRRPVSKYEAYKRLIILLILFSMLPAVDNWEMRIIDLSLIVLLLLSVASVLFYSQLARTSLRYWTLILAHLEVTSLAFGLGAIMAGFRLLSYQWLWTALTFMICGAIFMLIGCIEYWQRLIPLLRLKRFLEERDN